MPSTVFISHSSKDQAIADTICDHLESAGIECWIAPRNIKAGSDWTKGIMRGIANSRALSMADDNDVLNMRLEFALGDRDWPKAKLLLEKLKGSGDSASFAYAPADVPIGCYSILIARFQGENAVADDGFAKVREELNQKLQKEPESAPLLSQLAVVDALLNEKEVAIKEAKRAVEMLPISVCRSVRYHDIRESSSSGPSATWDAVERAVALRA